MSITTVQREAISMAPTLVTDWVTPGLMWVVVVAAAIWGAIWLIRAVRSDRIEAGYPTTPRCAVKNCKTPGVVTVKDAHGNWGLVCQRCADEGLALGWWARREPDKPYDQDLDGTDLHLWEKEL